MMYRITRLEVQSMLRSKESGSRERPSLAGYLQLMARRGVGFKASKCSTNEEGRVSVPRKCRDDGR